MYTSEQLIVMSPENSRQGKQRTDKNVYRIL